MGEYGAGKEEVLMKTNHSSDNDHQHKASTMALPSASSLWPGEGRDEAKSGTHHVKYLETLQDCVHVLRL